MSGTEETGAHENLAFALGERSLVAMARGEWSRAGALAAQAGSVLRRAGIEDSSAMPLRCAAQARVALHRETSRRCAGNSSRLSGCGIC